MQHIAADGKRHTAPEPRATTSGVDVLDMTGQAVLVTGGAGGVGRGITEAFLARGAEVVICGRNEPAVLPEVDGREAVFIPADVRDADAVAALVDATAARLGRLDVVVNNAGGGPPAFVHGTSPRLHSGIITLNLIAPLFVAQRSNDVMQAQESGGCIINIGSLNGMHASPGVAAYGAAKAGLLNLTQSLAAEWAPKVRVNAVTAGIIGTDETFEVHYANDPERLARLQAQVPMGRFTTPADVAGACVYLASPLATQVTGANLVVHGGGDPPDALPERPT
jgi:NAD(P)-dependent dehydrogenase (short-subunit alcohol dehydrogenase family)